MSTQPINCLTDEQIQAALAEQMKHIPAPSHLNIKSSWQKVAQNLTLAGNAS